MMTQVWERLFVGSHLEAEGLYSSNASRITTVVTLCEHKVLRVNPGINYVHIPIVDATPVPVGRFDAVIDAIGENIRWGTVLLHCHLGISRAPIFTAAWMDVVGYKNIDAALQDIRRVRPEVSPSDILLASVKEHLG